MPSFENVVIVVAVAFFAPLLLGLFPRIRLPSVVLEIVAGIVIGPSVLGIVEVDESVEVIALIGLAFVLFLAGLEIEFGKLRGQVLRLTAVGFALSFAIALLVSLGLRAGGLVETPLLVAIILCATSLGVLVPVLKDARYDHARCLTIMRSRRGSVATRRREPRTVGATSSARCPSVSKRPSD